MSHWMKANYCISITSYEIDEEDNLIPILTHLFWGDTYKQALSYAKSHLLSDAYFNSTFIGEMEWNNYPLYLTYDGEIYSPQNHNIDNMLAQLKKKAKEIRKKTDQYGIVQTIEKLSKH